MAQISTNGSEKIYRISKWLGVNQNPDGDTKLAYGEAAVMENWRVTRDGNLRRRPGKLLIETLGTQPVRTLWSGTVNDAECVIAECGGVLYRLFNGVSWVKETLGTVNGRAFVFGFDRKAYILDGESYQQYDGQALSNVEGYRPLVVTAAVPGGGGTALEQVNRLNGMRRARYSGDGSSAVFKLPETNIASVDYVTNLATGENVSMYSVDLAAGTVTMHDVPAQGVNNIEIGWTMPQNARETVERMRFAELYNGYTDSRVFLYGDGSNETIYSGLDSNGLPRADYFPDMNSAMIGTANTPVTAMVRHGSRLLVFKSDSTYAISYGAQDASGEELVTGFYVTPVHRSIGNTAPGQVQMVMNYPRSVFGRDIYEWVNRSSYTSADERQARRISDRVQTSMIGVVPEQCVCFDDNDAQEYYLCYDGNAIVNNYAVDAWYVYTGWDAASMCSLRGELYIGSTDGRILRVTDTERTDCGETIKAYWESGSMDFGTDYMRKYTNMLWISTKPETNSLVEVTLKTDKANNMPVRIITHSTAGFGNMDFSRFSFTTSVRPQTKKIRIKAKKYSYLKLILENKENDTTATVLAADIRARQTGYEK